MTLTELVNGERVFDILQPGVMRGEHPPHFIPSPTDVYLMLLSERYVHCGVGTRPGTLRIRLVSTLPTFAPGTDTRLTVASLSEIYLADMFDRPRITGIRWTAATDEDTVGAMEFEFEKIIALSVVPHRHGIKLGGVGTYQQWISSSPTARDLPHR